MTPTSHLTYSPGGDLNLIISSSDPSESESFFESECFLFLWRMHLSVPGPPTVVVMRA
jgi:hypothetical protein